MGDFALPADYPTVPASVYDDMKLVKLAREIAMGVKDLPDVLFNHGMTQMEFEQVSQLPHFRKILESEVAAWESAGNTAERVKLKAGSMIEEYLPELYARINDPSEPLMAKIKAMDTIAKLAGYGATDIPREGNPGDRVQVIINLGADHRLEYQKTLPPKVIDHAPSELQMNTSFEESIDARPNQV
jgi:hypothetical protein